MYIPWNILGFEICADFGDGVQALEYALANSVDIVLCDVIMPVMGGLEFARHAFEKNVSFKIVFLSAYKDFEFARQALVYGVKDYILKPASYNNFAVTFSRIKSELDGKLNARDKQENGNIFCFDDNSTYYQHITQVIQNYVWEHYRDVTLENAAEYLRISPAHFSRIYKNVTGTNFSNFVSDVKMQNAATFLKDIRYHINEVSDLIGYACPNNFTRAFKKHYHMSPAEYRKRSRSGR
jgi:YesN/AraC family two-component response regulator